MRRCQPAEADIIRHIGPRHDADAKPGISRLQHEIEMLVFDAATCFQDNTGARKPVAPGTQPATRVKPRSTNEALTYGLGQGR